MTFLYSQEQVLQSQTDLPVCEDPRNGREKMLVVLSDDAQGDETPEEVNVITGRTINLQATFSCPARSTTGAPSSRHCRDGLKCPEHF